MNRVKELDPEFYREPDNVLKLYRARTQHLGRTYKAPNVVNLPVIDARTPPVVERPLIRRFFPVSVLAVAKGQPIIGRFLLQRNLIKIGIPHIGISTVGVLSRRTTRPRRQ